jgi:hypothetical protein
MELAASSMQPHPPAPALVAADADRDPGTCQHGSATQDERKHIASIRTQRHANADFARARVSRSAPRHHLLLRP